MLFLKVATSAPLVAFWAVIEVIVTNAKARMNKLFFFILIYFL
jgi:hypothetical protein